MAKKEVEIPQNSGKVGYKSPPVATQFKPGNLANPGGKPVKARNKLQGAFMNALADDFEEHGPAAIVAMRIERPGEYVKVVASLMPKEIEVSANALDTMSEEELDATILAVQSILRAQADKLPTVENSET